MKREVLMRHTVHNMGLLPVRRLREVNDFVEFIVRQSDGERITEGLQQLASTGGAFDFLDDEPELYSADDLKEKFA